MNLWTITSAPRRETRDLIRRMTNEDRLWGADRSRGASLQLDIRVSKCPIQHCLARARASSVPGQAPSAFVRNHASDIWAGDCLQVTDRRCRPLFACFVIALGTRRVVHVGMTRHPTDACIAQQLHVATVFDQWPRYLLRDNDRTYGLAFACVAAATGSEELRTV